MTLDTELVASTLKHWVDKKFIDNVFKAPTTFGYLYGKKRIAASGGRFIVEPLEYATTGNAKWLSGLDTYEMAKNQLFTDATFAWRTLVVPVVIDWDTLDLNQGEAQVINWLEARKNNALKTAREQIEIALHTIQTGDNPNSLLDVCSDAGTFGGISRTTYAWWDAYNSESATTLSVSAMGVADLETTHGGESIDVVITSSTLFQAYEELVYGKYGIRQLKVGDVFFKALQFRGNPVIWSEQCAADNMYFLNTNFLKIVYMKNRAFMMPEFQRISGQLGEEAPIIFKGNLVCSSPRNQGMLGGRT